MRNTNRCGESFQQMISMPTVVENPGLTPCLLDGPQDSQHAFRLPVLCKEIPGTIERAAFALDCMAIPSERMREKFTDEQHDRHIKRLLELRQRFAMCGEVFKQIFAREQQASGLRMPLCLASDGRHKTSRFPQISIGEPAPLRAVERQRRELRILDPHLP